MKQFNRIFGFYLGLLMVLCSAVAHAELRTVSHVDLARYAGDWYQISHIPLFFEGGNCACARQRLTAKADGVLEVFNSCNSGGPKGKLCTISGEAYDDDRASNAKFTVDFHLAFKGTYWVIGLDPQYRFAVVSDRHQYSLYILSKTPTLSPELYKKALAMAQDQLDVSKVVMTEQKNCSYPNIE